MGRQSPARELCRSGSRQPVNFNIMSGPQAPSIQPAVTCPARVFSRQMHQKMSISGCKQGRIQDFSKGGGAKLPDIIIWVMICDSPSQHKKRTHQKHGALFRVVQLIVITCCCACAHCSVDPPTQDSGREG